MGCKDIALIGQDLAYESEKSHSPLADAGGDIKIGEDGNIDWKVKDPKSWLSKKENSMGPVQVVESYFSDGVISQHVNTNMGLLSFITSFETIARQNKEKTQFL